MFFKIKLVKILVNSSRKRDFIFFLTFTALIWKERGTPLVVTPDDDFTFEVLTAASRRPVPNCPSCSIANSPVPGWGVGDGANCHG